MTRIQVKQGVSPHFLRGLSISPAQLFFLKTNQCLLENFAAAHRMALLILTDKLQQGSGQTDGHLLGSCHVLSMTKG